MSAADLTRKERNGKELRILKKVWAVLSTVMAEVLWAG
jgi:hypothetical protein